MNAIIKAREALSAAYDSAWPHPDWNTIGSALGAAEAALAGTEAAGEPAVMMFTHLVKRAVARRSGADVRGYIDNIRAYLPD